MSDLTSCIELACKMNAPNSPVYDEFKQAMSSGPAAFASWLSDNGVPAELAKEISEKEGKELYEVIGDAVCERFW